MTMADLIHAHYADFKDLSLGLFVLLTCAIFIGWQK